MKIRREEFKRKLITYYIKMNNFKEIVEQDFNYWKYTEECHNAVQLNEKIGEKYFDVSAPHYFTGDLNAKAVLIHLNPKRNTESWGKRCGYKTFSEYWDYYSNFGKNEYGIESERKSKSNFDSKQVRFLKPFNVLPFKNGDDFYNLEIAIDKKLQLELIPYGSPNFNYSKVGVENIKPFINNLLDLLLSSERDLVIFCGRVFDIALLNYAIKRKVYEFRLMKKDGELTKNNYSLINLQLSHKGKTLNVGIAPQYAQQGCPVSRYAEKINEYYGKF